jgi:deazaflavin-dependent oxidoreductase (nitroreductase family)
MLPDRLRIFNKHVTNRVLRRFVYSGRGPFAIIHHAGRRSGKTYKTVIWVWPTSEGFVIALTYGRKVDWYRNMLAAGGGSVFWHNRLYEVSKPELIDAAVALLAFPQLFKMLFRLFGKDEEFVLLKVKSSNFEPVRARY